MIQITPQMRIVVAVDPVDFRRGIDGLARLCCEVLDSDPLRRLAVCVSESAGKRGVAPAKIISTKFKDDDPKQGVARTRPVCSYPEVAKYTGSGSIDDAADFVCGKPQ